MDASARRHWDLSLVIPAFNEEAGIAYAIAEADTALSALVQDYEILIVDDGSSDHTASIVQQQTAGFHRVRLLRHPRNRGYGAALRTGFLAAKYSRVAFTDADCQFDLLDLDKLLRLTTHAPIAVGYRANRQDPWRRKFYSRGYNVLVRTLLGTGVRDCDCALKVFRREVLEQILPTTRGFFVNAEMLTYARRRGFDIAEAPVTHRPRARGSSTVSLSDIPKTLRQLIPFWWTQKVLRTPLVPVPVYTMQPRVANESSVPVATVERAGLEQQNTLTRAA
jgi:dolichol-phosphate mannosyltransferase